MVYLSINFNVNVTFVPFISNSLTPLTGTTFDQATGKTSSVTFDKSKITGFKLKS